MSAQAEAKDFTSATEILTSDGSALERACDAQRTREGVDCKEGKAFPALPVFFGAFFYRKKKATSSVKLHLGIIKKLVLLEKQPSIFGR